MAIDLYGQDNAFKEPEGGGWDRSLDFLATIALAGGLTLGGLKYFPSAQRKLARTKLGKILGNTSKSVKAGFSSLFGNLSKVYVPSPHPAPGWGISRASDLTLQHELDVAIASFRASSPVSGAGVGEITRSIFNRATVDVPIAYGQVSALTVGDIVAGVGRNALTGAVGTTATSDLLSQIKTLSTLPGFRQSLAKMGQTPDTFWSKVPVGAFLAKEGKEVYSIRGGLRAALEDISHVRFPFTKFKPLSLLIPDLSPKPAVTDLGAVVAGKLFNAKGAIYAGGKVIPLGSTSPTSDTKGLTTGEILADYKLQGIKTDGIARAAAARMDILTPPVGGFKGWMAQAKAMPKWQRSLLKFARSKGIGPEWAGREGRFQSIIRNLSAVARGDAYTSAIPKGSTAAGVTPEGAFLRSLFHRPTGPVNSAKDLTWFERLVSGVGMPVKRPRLVDGNFQSEIVYGLPTRMAKRDSNMGLHSFGKSRLTGRQIEYTVSKNGGATGDWLNFHANRPLWMLSEFTGFNIKPGKNALSTMGQIGLKVALPAYVGYQALQYAEYKSRRILGVGPLTAAATAYTTARVGVQSVLDRVGITDVLKDTEEKYPGLIDSPASSGIRAGATTLGGIWAARSMQSKYGKMAAIAGGTVLGYMQLAGITKSASELSDEYTGKADVPVRSGRFWFLGRKPFGGGKIDRWEPSWYRQMWTRPTSVGRYGSAQESWRGSWLPLPENAFLLKNIYQPYYLESLHYHDAPYPVSSGLGGDLPIIGPLVEASVGRIIKPVQRREIPVSASPSTPGPIAVSGLNVGHPGASGETLLTNRLDIMTGDTLHRAFEWTGLPGFFVGAIRETVTGKDGWYLNKKALATSKSLASPTKDFYEMNMGGAWGLCIYPDTLVFTSRGKIPASEVVVGDTVLTASGKYQTITGVSSRTPTDEDRGIKITLKSIRTPDIKLTAQHEVLVYRPDRCRPKYTDIRLHPRKIYDCKEKPCLPDIRRTACSGCVYKRKPRAEYIPAGDVKPGDFMVYPRRLFDHRLDSTRYTIIDLKQFCDLTATDNYLYSRAGYDFARCYEMVEANPDLLSLDQGDMAISCGVQKEVAKEVKHSFSSKQVVVRYKRHVTVTPEVAYLIGIYLAEGSKIGYGQASIVLALHERETWIIDEANLGARQVGFSIDTITTVADSHGIQARSSHHPFCYWLHALGNCYTKSVPSFLQDQHKAVAASCLRGLIDGDGHIGVTGEGLGVVQFTTTSEQLALDVGQMMLDAGVVPNIARATTPTEHGVRFNIAVYSGAATELCEWIGRPTPCGHPDRSRKTHLVEFDRILVRVSSVEDIDLPDCVYDFEVAGEHNFVAGFVVVHNSEMARRFMPPEQNYTKVNPLRNNLASWLPGARSVFSRDRENYCISADTLVEVDCGLKTADTVSIGDIVRTHTGDFKPVTAVESRQIDPGEAVFEVRISGFSIGALTASQEHPIRRAVLGSCSRHGIACRAISCIRHGVVCQPSVVWTEVKHMRTGDYVVYPMRCIPKSGDVTIDVGEYFPQKTQTDNYVYWSASTGRAEASEDNSIGVSRVGSRYTKDTMHSVQQQVERGGHPIRLPRFLPVDEDFAYLLGWYCAEGSTNGKRGIQFSLNLKEEDVARRLISIAARMFGVSGKCYRAGENGLVVCMPSVMLSVLFGGLFGRGARNKKIPDVVQQFNIKILRVFLSSLWAGDGCFGKYSNRPEGPEYTRASFVSASLDLAYWVWSTLSDIGVIATIAYLKKRPIYTMIDGYLARSGTSYQVGCSGHQAEALLRFLRDGTMPEESSTKTGFVSSGFVARRVISVDPSSQQTVFGFSVDGDRSFCAAGMATHNTDFHTGSPFDMMERAEMRLPGPGWDVAHDNATPGMHSSLARFQILADVAPYSQAYNHYKRMLEGQVESGILDKGQTKRFVQVQNQVAEQMKSRIASGEERYGRGSFREQEVTIAETGATTFTTVEHPGMQFHLAGVESRPYALESAADDYGKLRRRMAEMRGQSVAIQYGGYGETTPAILGTMNQEAIEMGLGKKPIDALDYRAKHGSNMFQRSYEWLTQTSLPGPLGYPKTKWFGETSPIDEYKSFVRSGTWDTGWEQPYQNYLKPWFNQALGTPSSEFLDRNRLNEYMDNFKFTKYRRLANQYGAMGDARSASYYERQAEQTMVGLDPGSPDFFRNVGAAVPASERPYFAAFAGVTSERRQEEILNAVPNNMRQVYVGVWQRQAGTAGFNSPVLKRYAQEAEQRKQVDSAQKVAEFFANQKLPAGDHSAWHPQVDLNAVRIKMAEDEAVDTYALGMGKRAQAHANEYNELESPTSGDQTRMTKDQLYRILLENNMRNPSLFMGFPNSDHSFLFRKPNSAGWNSFGRRARMQGAI